MFKDRVEAGRILADKLSKYKGNKDVVILGIPRGGIITAKEVANVLEAPLDVVVIKKIGFPGNEEFALGAASKDDYYIDESIHSSYGVPDSYIEKESKIKQLEAKERYETLRGAKKPEPLQGKIVIIIDDGVATGSTMIMAARVIKKQKPQKVIIAVPVGPPETIQRLNQEANEVICLDTPQGFMAIGQFYMNFEQTTDEEAKQLLE
ncbi:MAG: phosphoribosyltransferase [DPANN group archaeon]|nr:phosphoribosyltransferase [DPANN group archaeon]